MSKKQITGKKKSIIQNYGLFWCEKLVNWRGVKGDPCALYGAAEKKADADVVDFREQIGIYVLYANYRLVYVGQTEAIQDALLSRLRYHRKYDLQGRWDMFSWFGTRYVTQEGLSAPVANIPRQPTTDILDVLEALVIAISEPQLNRQSGQFGDAVRYYQCWYEDETE